ncbi:S-adenosyl-L-methionine-dependent methyltransferase [Mycena albidolilacea]|uniref:S-adenosyl-L-methionine-dependent methyltransferase n=1 Tax=Mycena albidolilacea TaxID=1033008 RepID=A0AAD7EUW3_9AGAR|nr:S-adenosyl-L-methionine-dependent methyltransferase [Mycena albidolilacea]
MTSTTPTAYALVSDGAEWDRLDAQHNGIAKYLDHKLSPVDLGKPRKILEIGSGSGAWAIQAAKQYPDADVLAVDMNPLPARPLPSNIRFQQLDILQPFPFPAGTFDVIHVRFVLCHLPNGHTVLPRIIDLVAPGGWLLVDDIDFLHAFEGLDKAPGVKRGFTGLIKSMESHAGDPHFGTSLKSYLESSSALSEVNVTKVDVPINPIPEDPALGPLSRTMRQAFMNAVGAQKLNPEAVSSGGLTREVQQEFLAEMGGDAVDWSYSVQLFFSYSQKRA